RSMAARLLMHVVPALAAAALLPRFPAVAAALALLALTSVVAEQMTRGVWLSRPVTRYRSQNVVARLPPARPAARRVVLLAHYDTQPSGWVWTLNQYLMPLGVRSPLLLKPPFTPVVFLMLAELGAAAVAATVGPSAVVWIVAGLI